MKNDTTPKFLQLGEVIKVNGTHQLVGAKILRQIPLFNAPRLIAGYQLTLVRVDTNIVHYLRDKGTRSKRNQEKKTRYQGLRCRRCAVNASFWSASPSTLKDATKIDRIHTADPKS